MQTAGILKMNNQNPLGFEADYIKTHPPHSTNKKPFIIAFILLVIIILLILTCTNRASSNSNLKTTSNLGIEQDNILREAITNNDLTLCNSLLDPRLKSNCITSVTIEQGKEAQDDTLCFSLENPEDVELCRLEVLQSLK